MLCGWNTSLIGMVFDRPTGLHSQILRKRGAIPEMIEFDCLKSYYKKMVQHEQAKQRIKEDNILVSKTSMYKLFGTKSKLNSPIEEYKSQLESNKSNTWETILEDLDINSLSTEKQQIDQICMYGAFTKSKSELLPCRVPLKTIRSKSCKECDTLLVNPEPKASSTYCLEKKMVWDILPRIKAANIIESSDRIIPKKQLSLKISMEHDLLENRLITFNQNSELTKNCLVTIGDKFPILLKAVSINEAEFTRVIVEVLLEPLEYGLVQVIYHI
jgi:hypothetical protein